MREFAPLLPHYSQFFRQRLRSAANQLRDTRCQHFQALPLHTLRVEALKEFCDDAEVDYTKLVSHSGSRFLSLHPAIQKVKKYFIIKSKLSIPIFQIIKMFTPLKNFFESLSNAPANIKRFFDDETGLFWLKFAEAQLSISNEFVLKTESKKAASFEVAAEIEELRSIVSNRKQVQYIPPEAGVVLHDLSGDVQDLVKHFVNLFYGALEKYLEKWSRSLDGTEIFHGCSLQLCLNGKMSSRR